MEKFKYIDYSLFLLKIASAIENLFISNVILKL